MNNIYNIAAVTIREHEKTTQHKESGIVIYKGRQSQAVDITMPDSLYATF